MKLLRWAMAGASAYAVYKYSIGRNAKGEDVIVDAEREIEKLTGDDKAKKPAAKPKKPAASTRAAAKPRAGKPATKAKSGASSKA